MSGVTTQIRLPDPLSRKPTFPNASETAPVSDIAAYQTDRSGLSPKGGL